MNSLGTHDTARILTLLGAEEGCEHQSKEWRSSYRLGPDQRRRAKELLKLGAALMFAFPGSPTVYYGDEAGMEGYKDPFNRGCYPWGQENGELLAWYRRLGEIRRREPSVPGRGISFAQGPGQRAGVCAGGSGKERRSNPVRLLRRQKSRNGGSCL